MVMIPIGRVQVATPLTMAKAIDDGTEARDAVDRRIPQVLAENPEVVGAAAAAAAEATLSRDGVMFVTEVGATRTVSVDHPEFSHVVHSYDFRQIGGTLREDASTVGNSLPGYRSSHVGTGYGQVLITNDYRRVEPGGEASPDGLTPQAVLDDWSNRMSVGSAFTALAGWGDSMSMDYQAQGLSQTVALAQELGVDAFDRGVSGDTPLQIAWRMGGAEVRVTIPDGTITSADKAVSVFPVTGWNQARTQRAYVRDWTTGEQIPVILSHPETAPGATPNWSIRRASAGPTVNVLARTRVKHAQAFEDKARTLPAKFWIGRNNISQAAILEGLAEMVHAHRDPQGRRIISPVFNATNQPRGSAGYNSIIAVNAEIEAQYPLDYYDSRGALIEYGLKVAGISSVAGDANDVARTEDRIPPVFMLDNTHLNVLGRRTLARLDAIEIAGRSW